ncbi:hypothetical protein K1T71_001416 [Dendrolimus kikuchii]|uniref:Uncharacterized protein n=4 Tax=Dendrolimus kikuchii TaxID=765133 RepID=A0ACC1DHQ1_9NEOP|nr:hypothetical protein K1T71_007250 [Dendrolimus kikuchii]KAJ0181616.1 hypothetical protein K1T71_002338 [Dendrolimus kikuchii]KAJ0183422.1 hypothetical protein K1T71_001398 [Dendrolimus kikuchii]KAJ0183440.1 hypothetical protein K1T71_001416 [Dendrolimus kikuchii]
MPNNYENALKRLQNLEKKLDRDEELKAKYEERIENLMLSGYAERASTPPTSGRTWYLPHFAVVNPDKEKIRVVHDAAAKYHGRSLNDMLLPGPDLLRSLPGVIMKYRQYPVAVSADIKEMFMQVKIIEADRDALRFLNCLQCRLRRAQPASPSTGSLPAARLAHHSRPFTFTGVDYFGPLEVTVGRHREKRYVALFTCMTSRALHLEVVASLSADSAINALRRFIARRGVPTELWSDNATCFRSADRELAEAGRAVEEEASRRQIAWRFLPPAAPFMAGAWERMVRTVKEALRVTLREQRPSDETLATLLAEVEATVNSRPLTHVAVGPDEPPAITPNLLLLGPNCHMPAPGNFEASDVTARAHWRRAQYLADVFWRRWVREYLPLLQYRREPYASGDNPKVGDLVIICDPNLPRNTWPRGRVTAVHPGRDGEVRVLDVTTASGRVLRRPTKRVVVLPIGESRDATAGEC